MAVDRDTFRKTMGTFAAGVTVVTTTGADGQPYGLTATAFSSVSMEPPLALVCIDKGASSYPQFANCEVFAVNFLAADQEDVSNRFASSTADKFGASEWHRGELGLPVLEGTLGCAECRLVHAYDGGDHTIFVGEIEVAEVSSGEPLVYYRSSYRKLAAG
jgi:3-hydroxy-9,10-secoandrosta-1,3,5(10)-triene-9,17-dione monooxygenase reductase component